MYFKNLIRWTRKINYRRPIKLLAHPRFDNVRHVFRILHRRKNTCQLTCMYSIVGIRLFDDMVSFFSRAPLVSPPVWFEYMTCVILLLIFLVMSTTYNRKAWKTHLAGIILCGYIPWIYAFYSYIISIQVYLVQEVDKYDKMNVIESVMWRYWLHFIFEALRLQFLAIKTTWKIVNRSKPRSGKPRRY